MLNLDHEKAGTDRRQCVYWDGVDREIVGES